jgi:hypothetical protein
LSFSLFFFCLVFLFCLLILARAAIRGINIIHLQQTISRDYTTIRNYKESDICLPILYIFSFLVSLPFAFFVYTFIRTSEPVPATVFILFFVSSSHRVDEWCH